jgi:hypothetical protein
MLQKSNKDTPKNLANMGGFWGQKTVDQNARFVYNTKYIK